METATVPQVVQIASAAAASPLVAIAVAMATSLDEIRQVYGDECANFVANAWRSSANPRWEEVTFNALKHWTSTHPRLTLDLNS